MLSFFPRGVLDEILNLIESVSEGFPSYSFICLVEDYSRNISEKPETNICSNTVSLFSLQVDENLILMKSHIK